MAGRDVIRVVWRVEEAKEEKKLDLSDCYLQSVPDAIFLMLRQTNVIGCSLARNTIRKVPPKLGKLFTNLSVLDLSNNQLVSLPQELEEVTNLRKLDISVNNFAVLPDVVYKLSKLRLFNAEENIITDVDIDKLEDMDSLEEINLRENPLFNEVYEQLKQLDTVTVILSDRPDPFGDVD
ncbi:uncharacterized protein LOC141903946 [Tubulanus polymorphus]|uniref:uncharacterized protein LOC141903946 n=1 Tax=Tubulanus polymorphus TaxID=672921 RepID=UPI003DA68DDA